MHRFFLNEDLSPGRAIALPADIAHHIRRVLRLRAGDTIGLWNGDGRERLASIEPDQDGCVALVSQEQAPQVADTPRITLIQGLPEGDKMDWIVEKTCEAGVFALWPAQARRSVVRLQGERLVKRHAHWARVSVAACNQCGRTRLPVLHPVTAATTVFAAAAQAHPGALLWLLSPQGAVDAADAWIAAMKSRDPSALPTANAPPELVMAIGPEGGWDADEEAAARAAGFVAVKLGDWVLRTETAGVYACAQANAWWAVRRHLPVSAGA